MTNPLSVITGRTTRTNDTARELHEQFAEAYGLPTKLSRDGVLADVSAARELARDPEEIEERFGDENFFLRAAVAGIEAAADEENLGGDRDGLEDLLTRAAEVTEDRAGEIDQGVVQDGTPIEVDPVIVPIQDQAAPLNQYVDFEAQAGFTAQFNIISERGQPIGALSENDAIDLSSEDNGDWTLETDSVDMTIYVDRVNMSDFTQTAWDSLNWGGNDIEETTMGQRMISHARWRAGEMVYGDPDVGKSDGSIQDSNASPGMVWWAQYAQDNLSTGIDHVVDKSGLDTSSERARLDDLKSEVTELVTNTGADYSSLRAICGPEAFDTFEGEADHVVRLDSFDEGINYGGRSITLKNEVELTEVRAVGRDEHGGFTYNGTGDTPAGSWDIAPGDVIIYDETTFKRRQLAPTFTVPLARRGLADEAAVAEYKANIDKSHGAHLKFLQGYPLA